MTPFPKKNLIQVLMFELLKMLTFEAEVYRFLNQSFVLLLRLYHALSCPVWEVVKKNWVLKRAHTSIQNLLHFLTGCLRLLFVRDYFYI